MFPMQRVHDDDREFRRRREHMRGWKERRERKFSVLSLLGSPNPFYFFCSAHRHTEDDKNSRCNFPLSRRLCSFADFDVCLARATENTVETPTAHKMGQSSTLLVDSLAAKKWKVESRRSADRCTFSHSFFYLKSNGHRCRAWTAEQKVINANCEKFHNARAAECIERRRLDREKRNNLFAFRIM